MTAYSIRNKRFTYRYQFYTCTISPDISVLITPVNGNQFQSFIFKFYIFPLAIHLKHFSYEFHHNRVLVGREEAVQRERRAGAPLAAQRGGEQRPAPPHPRPHAAEQQQQAAQPVRRLSRRRQQGPTPAPLRYLHIFITRSGVADPGCLSRDLNFSHPGSAPKNLSTGILTKKIISKFSEI